MSTKFLFLVFICLVGLTSLAAQVFINEVLASNQSVNANSFGEYGDWVELFNASDAPINLEGYHLSDDGDELDKWTFPSCVIAPQAYRLIWATDRNLTTPEGEIHTNFKISNLETISLSSPGNLLVDQIVLPNLQPNVSFGRLTDGNAPWAYFLIPSPGLSNTTQTGYLGLLDPPVPSHASGFYPQEISLAFADIAEGAQLIYTLDGSIPVLGEANTFIYNPQTTLVLTDRSNQPNNLSDIRTTVLNSTHWTDTWYPPAGLVKKASIIRAKAVKPGHLDSQLLNLTYFVGADIAASYEGMTVVSIITDEDGFFDDYEGIYVAGLDQNGEPNTTTTANFQQDWERELSLQLWEPNRAMGFSTSAAAKLHGSASARLNRKGIRVNFKGSLGFENLSYSLLNPDITESFDAFVVRASGQDAHHLLFRDAVVQTFFKNQDIGSTDFRPAIVFINGEYWGIHNLRERSDEKFVARVYAADVEVMDCLENRGVANPDERVGTRTRYMSLLSFAKNNDLDIPANFETISSMLDVNNYLKYYIAQIFIANTDWPAYNVRMWRHKTELSNPGVFYQPNPHNPYLDGRFRWILFDLDQSIGRWGTHTANTIQQAAAIGSWNDNFFVLFRKLIGSTDANGVPQVDNNGAFSNGSQHFRNLFINYFCDALNTYLLPSKTTALITNAQVQYAPYMPEHIERWRLPSTLTTWNTYCNGARTFLNNRPETIRTQLANKFHLVNGTAMLNIDVNNHNLGYVQLNSLSLGSNPSFEPLPFQGIYYKDLPVMIKAIAHPGYRFVGWNGIESISDSLHLALSSDMSITAIFDLDQEDFPGDAMNPEPHNLNLGPYTFTSFSANSAPGTYPANMRFQLAAGGDPNINAGMTAPYVSAYNLTSRTRIEGLEGDGIAMINTGNPPLDGLSAGYLGAVVLGLKTTGLSEIKINFTVETQIVNERIYGIALQYRIGTEGGFTDVLADGTALRYISSSTAGHRQTYYAIALPEEVENQAYLQLRWKYYYISGSSGARPMIRLDDIMVYSGDYQTPSNIFINEIMAAINNWEHPLRYDDFGISSDWIELYNAGATAQNLGGCYLSDDGQHHGRWMFPSVSINPGEYLLVRASNQNIQNPHLPLHTNFAISTAGEPITLTAADGTVIDAVAEVPIPADLSYARMPDGSENWQLTDFPTPMAPNMGISAPTEVVIEVVENSVLLSWQAVPHASSYRIYAAESPDAAVWELIDTVSAPAWELNLALMPDKRFFRIIALR